MGFKDGMLDRCYTCVSLTCNMCSLADEIDRRWLEYLETLRKGRGRSHSLVVIPMSKFYSVPVLQLKKRTDSQCRPRRSLHLHRLRRPRSKRHCPEP
jgi:hypothetical protein